MYIFIRSNTEWYFSLRNTASLKKSKMLMNTWTVLDLKQCKASLNCKKSFTNPYNIWRKIWIFIISNDYLCRQLGTYFTGPFNIMACTVFILQND